MGDGDPSRGFVALDVRILSGRLDEEKGSIGDSALELLVRWFPRTFREGKASFTVQITDLHRESYRRRSSRDE